MICAAESEPLSGLVSGGPWKLTLREDKIPPEKTVPGGGEAAVARLVLSTADLRELAGFRELLLLGQRLENEQRDRYLGVEVYRTHAGDHLAPCLAVVAAVKLDQIDRDLDRASSRTRACPSVGMPVTATSEPMGCRSS